MKGDKEKTAFISGAAGGMGLAVIKILLGEGYSVIATDIRTERLSVLQNNDRLIIRELDVMNPGQIKFIADENHIKANGLDLLICLAGIYDTFPVTEASPKAFKQIIDVNLHGTAFLVQGFLEPLIRSKGRVIVITSESYKIQAMFQPYMISKAALEAYCNTARQELALKGVTLSVIRPGAIRTPLLNWMHSPGFDGKYPIYKYELETAWKRSIRMVGKISTPDKVAKTILKAALARTPGRVYRISNNPLLTIVAMIPGNILDRIMIWLIKDRQ